MRSMATGSGNAPPPFNMILPETKIGLEPRSGVPGVRLEGALLREGVPAEVEEPGPRCAPADKAPTATNVMQTTNLRKRSSMTASHQSQDFQCGRWTRNNPTMKWYAF